MKNIINKIIICLFFGIFFHCSAYGGIVTDRMGVGTYVPNPNNMRSSGRITMSSFTLTMNAGSGNVLTSDSAGRGTWQLGAGLNLLSSTNTWTAPNTWNMTSSFLSDVSVGGSLAVGSTSTGVKGYSLVTGPAWGEGGEAYMYLGDTNNYIKSGFGAGVTIQAQGSPGAISILQGGGGTGFGVPSANVNEMLSVAGRISILGITAPSNTAGYGKISENSSDKQLYYQDENGNKTQLSYDYAFFEDEKSNGSGGGDGTAGGWYVRALNSTTRSRGASITRSGNTFTLQSGTYRVVANAPFYGVNRCKIRLRNTSDSTTAIFGTSEYNYHDTVETGLSISKSRIDGIVTVSSAKTFQIEYYISNHYSGGEDLGVASSSGDTEVYTKAYIQKIN